MGKGLIMNEAKAKKHYTKNLAVIKATQTHVRAYLLALYELHETKSYTLFYSSWEAFLKEETSDIAKSTFDRFRKAENVRRNLVDKKAVLESECFPESHFLPIYGLTDTQQVSVFSEVHEVARKQKRVPTANDYKVAADKYAKKKIKKEDEQKGVVLEGKVVKKTEPILEGYIKKGEAYCCPTCNGTGTIVPDKEVLLELATPEFFEAWASWLNYRKKRKLPKYAEPRKLINKLAAMGHDNAIAAIDLAITQNWNGIHDKPQSVKAEKTTKEWGEFLP